MEEINQIIKDHSDDTAVTFLRFPSPKRNYDKESLRLFSLLKIQSENLPPVIHVFGNKTVVSTSL